MQIRSEKAEIRSICLEVKSGHALRSHNVAVIKPRGPVSRNSRKLFGPEKPFAKLRSPYLLKLVFSYVVKGIKIKITTKFRALRRLGFEDTQRTTSPKMRPKSFGTFEKRDPATIEVSKMAHTGRKIRLCDRDVYPAITDGPANVFSSIPFLLVRARYDIKFKTFEVVYMYIS